MKSHFIKATTSIIAHKWDKKEEDALRSAQAAVEECVEGKCPAELALLLSYCYRLMNFVL